MTIFEGTVSQVETVPFLFLPSEFFPIRNALGYYFTVVSSTLELGRVG